MDSIPSNTMKKLAGLLPKPLYVTGGFVRNRLLELPVTDSDVCSALTTGEVQTALTGSDFLVRAVYPRMGTMLLEDATDGSQLEYTAFRTESYAGGGGHTPCEVRFGCTLEEDALRRDFTINAIYCDCLSGELTDPTGGLADLKSRTIRTVTAPETVFGSDGLRLLRMVRFCAQLGFSPEDLTYRAAVAFRGNLMDISVERKADEFLKILDADRKYPALHNADGHLRGVRMLMETGMMEYVLPELTLGVGMAQRADFHKYDVAEHSIRAFALVPPHLRLTALLHDIGKPAVFLRKGNFHGHEIEGAEIAYEIALERLKLPKAHCRRIRDLVAWHMYDLNCRTRENKLRVFLAEHSELLEDLFLLKNADYEACGFHTGECPTVTRMRSVLQRMREQGAPNSLKELDLTAADLKQSFPEIPARHYGLILKKLFELAVKIPSLNTRETLLKHVKGIENAIHEA